MPTAEYFGRNYPASVSMLMDAGISCEDACALRRISMTLHRWHELECGDGNDYGSWCITRGRKERSNEIEDRGALAISRPITVFVHDDDGRPYLEHHHYRHGQGRDSTTYTPLADRERGALKRLDKIMARYPGFQSYVQGDPRGCALYIIRPDDIPFGNDPSTCYDCGIAVRK